MERHTLKGFLCNNHILKKKKISNSRILRTATHYYSPTFPDLNHLPRSPRRHPPRPDSAFVPARRTSVFLAPSAFSFSAELFSAVCLDSEAGLFRASWDLPPKSRWGQVPEFLGCCASPPPSPAAPGAPPRASRSSGAALRPIPPSPLPLRPPAPPYAALILHPPLPRRFGVPPSRFGVSCLCRPSGACLSPQKRSCRLRSYGQRVLSWMRPLVFGCRCG